MKPATPTDTPVAVPPPPLEGANPFGGAFYPQDGGRVDVAAAGPLKGVLKLFAKKAPLVLDTVDEATKNLPAPTTMKKAAAKAADATDTELARRAALRGGASPLVNDAAATLDTRTIESLATVADVPKYAININLDNLQDPQQFNGLINNVAEAMKGQVDEARRGVRTNADTLAAAQELFKREEGFMLNRAVGEAFNAEQITATRYVLASQRNKTAQLAQKLMSGSTDAATMLDFRRSLSQLGAVQLQLHGMAAEAGRALQAFRMQAQADVMQLGTEAAAMVTKDASALIDAEGGQGAIVDLAKSFLDLPTPAAQNAMARESTRRGASDMLRELWFNFVLSGPATHMRNMIGNGLALTTSTAERAVAAQWGRAFGFLGAKQGVQAGEAFAMVQGYWNALGDAWRLANFAFRHGESVGRETGYRMPLSMREIWTMGPDQVAQVAAKGDGSALSSAKVTTSKGPAITGENVLGAATDTANKVARKLVGRDVLDPARIGERGALGRMTDFLSLSIDLAGGVLRTPTRALGAEDQFWKTIAFRGEATARLHREGLSAGLSGVQLRDYVEQGLNFLTPADEAAAEKFARTITMAESIQSPIARGFQAIGAAPFGHLIAPFVKVATNILDYSTQRVLFPARPQWWREVASSDPVVRDLAMAKASTGALAWATAFVAAGDGNENSDGALLITGAGPQEPQRRAVWLQRGFKPYSIRVGGKDGKWVQYSRLDPAGQMLGIAADSVLILGRADEVTATEFGAALVAGVGNNLVNKSFMSAMAEGMEVFTSRDPEQYVKWAQRSMASYAVPNAITQITQESEPYLHRATGVLQEIQRRRSPEGARALPFVRGLDGKPVKMEYAFGTSFSGVAASDAKEDAVADELWRLQVPFSRPMNIVNGVELDDWQYDRYQALVGYALKMPAGTKYRGPAVGPRRERIALDLDGLGMWQALGKLVKHPAYKHATDGGDPPGQKAQMILDIRKRYMDDARTRLLGEYPELVDKSADAEVKKAQADGVSEDRLPRIRTGFRATLQRRVDQVKSYEVAE